MSLLTLAPAETSIAKIVGCVRQLVQYVQALILLPIPTRAGDVAVWNGTAWTTLAGNNAGTKVLQEDSSGNPSWGVPGAGTVTSVATAGLASGGPITATGTITVTISSATNSLGGNVALTVNVEADGPSIVQGSVGTWFASGGVTVGSPTSDNFHCRLWDGATLIDSCSVNNIAGSQTMAALSGVIAAPAGNLRISVTDASSSSGRIFAAISGFAKDSTLTALRIA